ncbi:recombinase family protein [Streptomyces sp. NPDC059467]|uniref:recombinase family protein n=1 Tax=Streptomyces sp. NPDC059467 TaxID=3346844 RepID=UPI0036B315A7
MATSEGRKPRQAGGYVRISNDPLEEEKGVTRQREDVEALAERLGWKVGKIYPENDTSAYKRKRIELPDGRHVWRVIRPEFRQMLRDYQDGVIDGIIVYDLDRLARQPRDLEDLIDLVDHYRRPVVGVTGSLDLMTDNGKAMARVLMAMANKSSADTSRRVSRERVQRAREGRSLPPNRAFGWEEDRLTRRPEEAALIRKAVLGFTAGENWSSITRMFMESGISPASGKTWYLTTIRNMLLSPRVAGIVTYWGRDGSPLVEDEYGANDSKRRGRISTSPRDLALRDTDGQFVRGKWQQIVTVEQWDAFVAEYERRKEGKEFTSGRTKKYLLSGLLRCARPREDGTPCGRGMVGVTGKHPTTGKPRKFYKCPSKNMGGCGSCQREMTQLDQLIEDLLFLHLETNQPGEGDRVADGQLQAEHPDAAKLADVQARLKAMREGMRDGKVSPESFFAVVPGLETQERQLIASLSKARRAQVDRDQRRKSPEKVRAEWQAATVPGKRAILGQYLRAVMVHPARPMGRSFDHETIVPVWKPLPQ